MTTTENLTAINDLANLFSSSDDIGKVFILLLCILIPLLSIVIPKLNSKIDTQDPIFLYFRTKAKRRNDRNEMELELYADLNEYVLPIKNIKELTPVEAANFKSTIDDIISERKLYITNFLEDCLSNLDYYLDSQDPDYTLSLVQIRNHIMREYQSLRKSLGYPTVNIFNRLLYYSPFWETYAYCGCFCLLLAAIFMAISAVLSSLLSATSVILYHILIIFIQFAFIFSIWGITWVILFFISHARHKKKNKVLKKKLFGNPDLPISKNKHKKKNSYDDNL